MSSGLPLSGLNDGVSLSWSGRRIPVDHALRERNLDSFRIKLRVESLHEFVANQRNVRITGDLDHQIEVNARIGEGVKANQWLEGRDSTGDSPQHIAGHLNREALHLLEIGAVGDSTRNGENADRSRQIVILEERA